MAQLPERVARLEVQVEDVENEQLRMRRRLHELETDRATVRLLAKQVSDLVDGIEAIATRAAEKALSLAVDARKRARQETWSYAVKLISGGAAASGAVTGILVHFL